MVDATVERFGKLDDLINNVGGTHRSAMPAGRAEATLVLIRTKSATGHVFLGDGGMSLVG